LKTTTEERVVDLSTSSVRELNHALYQLRHTDGAAHWHVREPRGAHSVACGLTVPVRVEVDGPTGYYCAGMNQVATVILHGNTGTGVAENMMSGFVHVKGNASQSAGATGQGGLLVIDGNAGARCGISMKGIDIVVKGSVGHMSAFMAQAGNLVVCGDAGDALGDSIYEARIFVRGKVADLGADCIEKEMRDDHRSLLADLLAKANLDYSPSEFRRYGSERKLYNFKTEHAGHY
jgi:glutamate synthase domain-containing protein 3